MYREPPTDDVRDVTPSTPEAPPPDSSIDTGLACLVMMARFHGIAADAQQIAHEQVTSGEKLSTADLLLASRKLDLQAKSVQIRADRLPTTPLPAIAVGPYGQYFILARVEGDKVLIQSPVVGRPRP